MHIMPLDPLPEFLKGINSLSIADIENPASVKIYHNSLVYVSFLDGKFINANVLDSFQ